ncbi:hypothetical protein [Nocardia transvalensis]|uniref:hypothetical protein n=1 Tax=Nocardia transvalensis TaxID=37333 RepID=UPI001894C1B7|nr:hypothetical protein [Nocardia transvalensis]MBF6330205.1 hypothetical protein [Nocardia transvalensis]
MGLRSGWRRLLGRADATGLDPDRDDLVVVVSSFDDAEACSAALRRAAGWVPEDPAVLRHHLRVPVDQADRVIDIAAQDGYAPAERTESDAQIVELVLRRVQLLDALHCSQERSRMAGLAQRHDGVARGWDALQPGDKRIAGSH